MNDDDDDTTPLTAEAPPAESSSSQPSVVHPSKATKAQVDRVINQARQLFPRDLFIGTRVKTEARRCGTCGGGLSWVAQALDVAEKAQARSWGYVANTLRNWREEGGPPPPPPTAEELAAAQADFDRRLLEELGLL